MQARRRDHHAEPEDVGQRQAVASSAAWGCVSRSAAARTPTRSTFVKKLYKQRAGARPRRARARRRRSCRRRSATCTWPGRTRRTSRWRRRRASSRSSTRRSASSPSRTSPWSTRTSSARARATAAKAYLEFLYTPEAPGDHRQELLPADRRRRCSRSTARAVPDDQAVPDHGRRQELGRGADEVLRRRRRVRQHLQAEEVSDRATQTEHRLMIDVNRRVLPGLRPEPRLHDALPEPAGRSSRWRRASARRRRSSFDEFWARRVHRPRHRRLLRSRWASFAVGRRSTSSSACSSPGCWCATSSRCKRLFDSLVDLPFALPTAVAGSSTRACYVENGWSGSSWCRSASRRVLAARHRARAGLHRLPVRRAHGAAGAREPRADVEEAAACLGANRCQTFRA